jgi:hypothetical protein
VADREGVEVGRARAVPLASLTAFSAALAITLLSGVPHPLPGIALGSAPLFYIERGVAAFAALVIATSLLGRGLKGELPSQVSTTGLTYPERLERAVTSSDVAMSALASRVDQLDEDLRKRDEVMRLLASQVLDLSTDIEGRKGSGGTAARD